ncbi:MAG TPA: menaquinone biosynthesis protein [Pyrinomonadaceae bacterium]|jgi:chorismate dehydratase|nr:menaquinone biosynthesis protein [Pyrinomonadaceae bacterium]
MMTTPRISASSYSNTAPLVWSFLYGQNHGKVEIILDNVPARSAQLLEEDRVDAALVPVIAYQMLKGVRLIPGVCVGAREKVRSVCLVTKGKDLADVRSVALDSSSRTSVALTKIIFREFLGFEPAWCDAAPDIDRMLADTDAALIIGDPSLAVDNEPGGRLVFDLAELWRAHTGLGFIFAMWMTRQNKVEIDFAAARDEGLANVDSIAASYAANLSLSQDEMLEYLTENIAFTPDTSMLAGMRLYFELAEKYGLIATNKALDFAV